MRAPKPISLTQIDSSEHKSRFKPKPFVVVGDIPGGGEDSGPTAWDDITGKPTTFPPTIGTTATTAMAGNTTIPPAATWANLSGKPASFPPATHDHTIAQITGLQAIITDLTDRIEALEAAAE